jgi:hypothetical protein
MPPRGGAASTNWLELQAELLVAVSTHCATAIQLIRMNATCRTWRLTLRNEDAAWRLLTLKRFPRVSDLLRLSQATPVSFKRLYRDQLEAENSVDPAMHPMEAFIFTVELLHEDQVIGSWTGRLAGMADADAVLADGTVPRLVWSPQLPPALEGLPAGRAEALDNHAGYSRMRLFVTHELESCKLYEAECEGGGAGSTETGGNSSIEFLSTMLPRRVCAADFGYDEETMDFEMFAVLEWRAEGTAVQLRFLGDGDHNFVMSSGELCAYLNDMVPWHSAVARRV